MHYLAQLLTPYPVDTFLNRHWRQQGVHIPAPSADKFKGLFSWAALTHLLNFHDKRYPLFRLAHDKQVLGEPEIDNFLHHCQQGATLIIDQVHKRLPAVAHLASAIRYDLGIGHRTQVNAYCSWPNHQGFDCHYDTHEVFILQIEGIKEWFVFPETIAAPLPDQPVTAPPAGLEPYLHTHLAPGDVLYIPRGHWHYAIAQEQPSVHLTLGVHCQTGLDFLHWLAEQLKERVPWRESLPPGVTSLDAGSLQTYVRSLVDDIQAVLQAPDLARRYADALASRESPLASYDFPHQVDLAPETLTAETRLYRPPFQRVMVDRPAAGQQHRLRIGPKEIKLTGVPPDFIEHLFSRQTFTVGEVCQWLPGFDWAQEIQPLLAYLIQTQVLRVNPSPLAAPDPHWQAGDATPSSLLVPSV